MVGECEYRTMPSWLMMHPYRHCAMWAPPNCKTSYSMQCIMNTDIGRFSYVVMSSRLHSVGYVGVRILKPRLQWRSARRLHLWTLRLRAQSWPTTTWRATALGMVEGFGEVWGRAGAGIGGCCLWIGEDCCPRYCTPRPCTTTPGFATPTRTCTRATSHFFRSVT
jgi:hypothetical protein